MLSISDVLQDYSFIKNKLGLIGYVDYAQRMGSIRRPFCVAGAVAQCRDTHQVMKRTKYL